MPPYPPKPLAGHVLGKGSEKLWKERKEAPRQESLFGAESGIAPLSECFYLIISTRVENTHLLVAGPGRRLLCVPPGLAGPLLDGSIHPYPLCIPLEGLTKVVVLVLQGERYCGVGRALRRGLAYRCSTT
jgi:hypothetical protein